MKCAVAPNAFAHFAVVVLLLCCCCAVVVLPPSAQLAQHLPKQHIYCGLRFAPLLVHVPRVMATCWRTENLSRPNG
jgi:hypothetical protein